MFQKWLTMKSQVTLEFSSFWVWQRSGILTWIKFGALHLYTTVSTCLWLCQETVIKLSADTLHLTMSMQELDPFQSSTKCSTTSLVHFSKKFPHYLNRSHTCASMKRLSFMLSVDIAHFANICRKKQLNTVSNTSVCVTSRHHSCATFKYIWEETRHNLRGTKTSGWTLFWIWWNQLRKLVEE